MRQPESCGGEASGEELDGTSRGVVQLIPLPLSPCPQRPLHNSASCHRSLPVMFQRNTPSGSGLQSWEGRALAKRLFHLKTMSPAAAQPL